MLCNVLFHIHSDVIDANSKKIRWNEVFLHRLRNPRFQLPPSFDTLKICSFKDPLHWIFMLGTLRAFDSPNICIIHSCRWYWDFSLIIIETIHAIQLRDWLKNQSKWVTPAHCKTLKLLGSKFRYLGVSQLYAFWNELLISELPLQSNLT